MIISRIVGGLGNQLFQYAAGRALAERNKTDLVLDLSAFKSYDLHSYCLDHFSIKTYPASEERAAYFKNGMIPRVRGFLSSYGMLAGGYVRERSRGFYKNILKMPNNTYLEGYWQSERYFENIKDSLRRELTLKKDVSVETKRIVRSMSQGDSVSVHIRRGDYIDNPDNRKIYVELEDSYYNKAFNYIGKRIKAPHYYVFSDDVDWVKENLDIPGPVSYMDFNGIERNYEDLYLMSKCKSHIIANSSFSWWGAWLDNNSRKLVVTPAHWCIKEKKSTDDRYPNEWVKL